MKKSGLITTIVIVCLVLIYLLFVDKQGRRTYQAYVAVNGSGPLGITDPPWNGPDMVVVYRTGHNDVICYEAFRSQFLHDQLSAKNGQPVVVEYDTFSDFGKIRGYNVHSIDGLILANGSHVLRPEFAGRSGVASKGPSVSIGSDDCW